MHRVVYSSHLEETCGGSPCEPAQPDVERSLLFFSLLHQNPSRQDVPVGAPKIDESDSAVIVIHKLAVLDPHSKTLRLELYKAFEELQAGTVLLTPSTFSAQEWRSLRLFDVSETLHLDFGIEMPAECDEQTTQVC